MASAPQPHTRAFLFADLRGYSAFTERHGDQAARELLSRYRHSVREVIASFDGAEIRTEGDSFYVVFDSVSPAVRAGLAILVAIGQAPANATAHPVLVGIGIHAGETEDSAEGIVSSAVNVAARICAQAEPGELLVSDTVRALTRSYLDVSFLPRGRRRLKGIAEPVALYRVISGRAAGERLRGGGGLALSRRWLQRAGVAAAAAVAIVAVAILGWPLLRASMAGEGMTASVEPSDQSSPDAGASGTLAPFPIEAEQGLLEFVDQASLDRCSRPDDGPSYLVVGSTRIEPTNIAFTAGIDCALGGITAPDQLRIWKIDPSAHGVSRYEQNIQPSAILVQKAAANAAPRTSCGDEVPAIEQWSFGGSSGLLTCYETVTGDAMLWWTYDGTDLLATATRDDRDMDALLAWWTAEARFAP
jgi:class 3 adenylate cyclase